MKTIYEAASIALDEAEGWPCNLQDMTEREQEIARTAERLCGSMKFIQEHAEKHMHADLTQKDVEFLVWALGWIEGRLSADQYVRAEDREMITKRCHEIWPKLPSLL